MSSTDRYEVAKPNRNIDEEVEDEVNRHFKYKIHSSIQAKEDHKGMFNSVLVYCLPLFGGCDVGQLRDIQILQNKAAQIVCNAPPRAHRAAMYDALGWMTVRQLVVYHSLLMVFKIRKSGEPEYLARKLEYDNRLPNIIIPNTGLSLAKQSFTYRAAQQWNLLPRSIRNILKIGKFKKELKKWTMMNIPRFND